MSKETAETVKSKKTDLWWIPYSQTDGDESKNPREESNYDITEEELESVRKHGILNATRGYKKNGRWFIVHGNRRRRMAKALYEQEGIDVLIPVMSIGKTADDEAYLIETFIGNAQRPLTPLEQAKGVKVFSELGYKNTEIADKLFVSKTYIGSLLKLANAPEKLHNLIRRGGLSATTAMKALRDGTAEELLEKFESGEFTAGVDTSGGNKEVKERVTNKDLEGVNSWKEFKNFAKFANEKDFGTEKQYTAKQIFKFMLNINNNEVAVNEIEKFFKVKYEE